jgi:RNA polymerase sigma factor (sigma-70 family)
MNPSSLREIELTPDLLEYARSSAIKEARKRCPKHVVPEDVAQEAVLKLLSNPPKFDATKNASEKTLIYTIVFRVVLKYAVREATFCKRYPQEAEPTLPASGESEPPASQLHQPNNRRAELRKRAATTEDILDYIDNEEGKSLCRLVIECGGNVSEAARRVGLQEGTVRYRFKLLRSKLLAAGFDPFPPEDKS